MILNRLSEESFRSVDRLLGWLLVLFGYIVSAAMTIDTAGWDDPVFNVVRHVPYTPYSWAAALAISTSVYTIGETSKSHRRFRGRFIILGAALCFTWFATMSLMMARVVYEMPMRVTDLWPLVMFFISVLYASRIIVYANIFHGRRWATNPYQLWCTTFLLVVSMSQMVVGVAPTSVFSEVERPVAFELAAVNFLGAAVIMFGLHLRNVDVGLNLELAGAASLFVTLLWYCYSVVDKQVLAGTTLGFGEVEAVLLATLHRSFQIFTLKWARWRDKPNLERRMVNALNPVTAQEDCET